MSVATETSAGIKALALEGKSPERAADWLEGWHSAGGMCGWLLSGEVERLQAVIAAQDKIIAALTAQLSVQDRMVS